MVKRKLDVATGKTRAVWLSKRATAKGLEVTDSSACITMAACGGRPIGASASAGATPTTQSHKRKRVPGFMSRMRRLRMRG